jgi:hypothetical protein
MASPFSRDTYHANFNTILAFKDGDRLNVNDKGRLRLLGAGEALSQEQNDMVQKALEETKNWLEMSSDTSSGVLSAEGDSKALKKKITDIISTVFVPTAGLPPPPAAAYVPPVPTKAEQLLGRVKRVAPELSSSFIDALVCSTALEDPDIAFQEYAAGKMRPNIPKAGSQSSYFVPGFEHLAFEDHEAHNTEIFRDLNFAMKNLIDKLPIDKRETARKKIEEMKTTLEDFAKPERLKALKPEEIKEEISKVEALLLFFDDHLAFMPRDGEGGRELDYGKIIRSLKEYRAPKSQKYHAMFRHVGTLHSLMHDAIVRGLNAGGVREGGFEGAEKIAVAMEKRGKENIATLVREFQSELTGDAFSIGTLLEWFEEEDRGTNVPDLEALKGAGVSEAVCAVDELRTFENASKAELLKDFGSIGEGIDGEDYDDLEDVEDLKKINGRYPIFSAFGLEEGPRDEDILELGEILEGVRSKAFFIDDEDIAPFLNILDEVESLGDVSTLDADDIEFLRKIDVEPDKLFYFKKLLDFRVHYQKNEGLETKKKEVEEEIEGQDLNPEIKEKLSEILDSLYLKREKMATLFGNFSEHIQSEYVQPKVDEVKEAMKPLLAEVLKILPKQDPEIEGEQSENALTTDEIEEIQKIIDEIDDMDKGRVISTFNRLFKNNFTIRLKCTDHFESLDDEIKVPLMLLSNSFRSISTFLVRAESLSHQPSDYMKRWEEINAMKEGSPLAYADETLEGIRSEYNTETVGLLRFPNRLFAKPIQQEPGMPKHKGSHAHEVPRPKMILAGEGGVREWAASELQKILGMDFGIPENILMPAHCAELGGDSDIVAYQEMVPFPTSILDLGPRAAEALIPTEVSKFLFDLAVLNTDKHEDNALAAGGRIHNIDHGLCLPRPDPGGKKKYLGLRSARLFWLTCPEAKVKISEDVREGWRAIDPSAVVDAFRKSLGEQKKRFPREEKLHIPEECFKLLEMNLRIIKSGIEKNKTLEEIGSIFQARRDTKSKKYFGGEIVSLYSRYVDKEEQDWPALEEALDTIFEKPLKQRFNITPFIFSGAELAK